MNEKIWYAILLIGLCSSCKNNNEAKEKPIAKAVHIKTMNELFPKPQVEIKTVGIFLYDGYSPLDAMGPYSVFTHLMGTNVFFIAKHKGIIEGGGLKVQVDTTIDEVKHLDILLIPGGLQETYLLTKDKKLLSWVRSIDSTSKYTTSVCTGAWILGAAGLLKDKEATTHWYGKRILADSFQVKVQNKRYVQSGKYWTSAGVSAGIDMSLAMLNEIAGEQYTKTTMLNLEYDPQPPFIGGSENNTDKGTVEGMRTLYDGGMDAALHLEKMLPAIRLDNAKDFVCGMPLETNVSDTVQFNGKVYGFCSKGCTDEFKKNPLSYLKR